jgi:L-threonylcarbamoyladenylate synthase
MRISIEEAIRLLECGQVVAIPTETVYGLAAKLSSKLAISKVFELKNRPADNPLIIHVKDKEECKHYLSDEIPSFDLLAKSFWPGPLTFVLPVKIELIPEIARAHLTTCAFRIPNHPITAKLLQRCSPLVAPSANLSGRPSATRAEHVENDFGSDFPVLDGGASLHGVESTIMVYRDEKWQIARKGAISPQEIEQVLGYLPEIAQSTSKKPICPGQLYRHYAPNCQLHLGKVYAGEPYVVGFSDRNYAAAKKIFSLGKSTEPKEAAFRLYDALRALDIAEIKEAFVDVQVEDKGIWQTVLERLSKAALH